ncbi:serine/threonine protein kinase, CMGC, partial [Coemansia erecta]
MAKKQKAKTYGTTAAHTNANSHSKKVEKQNLSTSAQPHHKHNHSPVLGSQDPESAKFAGVNPSARNEHEIEPASGRADSYSRYSNSDDYEDDPDMDEEDIEDYRKGGYHPVKVGDSFKDGRYKVVRKLGWGHFSTVWLAYDHVKDIHVALKIVKSAAHYTEAALDEIELCSRTMTIREPHVGRDYVAKMLDSFEYSGPNGRHV